MFAEHESIDPSTSPEEGALTKAARLGAPIYDSNWGIRHLRIRVPARSADEKYDFCNYCLHDDGRWDSWSFNPANAVKMAKNYVWTDLRENLNLWHINIADVAVVGMDVVRQFQPSKEAREVMSLLAQMNGSPMPDVIFQEQSYPAPAPGGETWSERRALLHLGGSSLGAVDCGGDIPRLGDVIWFAASVEVDRRETDKPLCLFAELAPVDIWCALKAAWVLSDLDQVTTLRDERVALLNLVSGRVVVG